MVMKYRGPGAIPPKGNWGVYDNERDLLNIIRMLVSEFDSASLSDSQIHALWVAERKLNQMDGAE